MRRLVRLVASLALIAAGCSDRPPDAPALAVYGIAGGVNSEAGAGLAGVVLDLTGASTASTTSSSSGAYAFGGLVDGDYTVTPSLAGYAFSPVRVDLRVSGGDASASTFTGRGVWYAIASGTTHALRGVWGSGASDVWAVGDSGTILH